jgi:hypothetical protein
MNNKDVHISSFERPYRAYTPCSQNQDLSETGALLLAPTGLRHQ